MDRRRPRGPPRRRYRRFRRSGPMRKTDEEVGFVFITHYSLKEIALRVHYNNGEWPKPNFYFVMYNVGWW